MSEAAADARYPWLENALGNDGVVVTANRRLARELTAAWNDRQLNCGNTAWVTPAIYSWHAWLGRLALSAKDPSAIPRRLDPVAAALLWERSLKQRIPDGVLGIAGVVRQAGNAWARTQEWDIGVSALLATAASDDEKWFASASAAFDKRLQSGHWTDGPGLACGIIDAINRGSVMLPARLTVAGFDRLSPVVARLLEAVSRQHCEVAHQPPANSGAPPEIADFDHHSAELRAAGAWARQQIEANPLVRIGIICPDLETEAAHAVRCIREGLLPGWQLTEKTHTAAIEVSYGRRLSEYPAIAVALTLLRWACGGLTGAELSPIILSVFFRQGAEGSRERLELSLREYPDRRWDAGAFVKVFNTGDDSSDVSSADEFLTIAGRVQAVAANAERAIPPAECISIVDELLEACGWPGEQKLDSAAFQLVNRWRELLNEFARIDAVAPTISLGEAIRRIDSLASETIWQPEVDPGIVQVLGPLEAAGMTFDSIWVAGMDASSWPPASRPAPYISLELQRQRNMPDATPADTLDYARRTLSRLIGSAQRCVLSWSRAQNDAEQVPSTLLDEIDTVEYTGTADPGWYAANLCDREQLERIAEDTIRAVATDERVWGGAYTIQQYFTEPFAALVAGRLGVRRPEPFITGLSPSARGSIIHNALHELLNDKPQLAELNRWSADEISRRTGAATDRALAPHVRHADPVLARLIGFERERVRDMLAAFLSAEKERDEKIKVVAVELPLSYEQGAVELGFRVDRVDRLSDGRLLIIDYKTGAPKNFLNQAGELRDLQPVLYADAIGEPVGGLAFLNIDSRAIAWRQALGDPGNEDDTFDEQLVEWKRIARGAVRGFGSGDVRMNVLQSSGEARPLAILSRIEEYWREQ